MKKAIIILICVLSITLLFASTVSAHELFIEVEEDTNSNDLRVDVQWGHLGDFYDNADHEDYELYVRYPGGDVEQLELEGVGVHGRAFLNPTDDGEYIFWAERTPSIYAPQDGEPRLSVQMAKTVYQYGEGPGTVDEPTEMDLEIVTNVDLTNFVSGEINGTVLSEGNPVEEATIHAYGPEGQVLEDVSDAEGSFTFDLDSPGTWVMKANNAIDEAGDLDGEEYQHISQATTLLLYTDQEMSPNEGVETGDNETTEIDSASTEAENETPVVSGEGGSSEANNGNSTLAMGALFLVGLLLGGSGSLFLIRRKQA